MRQCSRCPAPLPQGRKLWLCRDCARRYMANRRSNGRVEAVQQRRAPSRRLRYCGACGYRLSPWEEACCAGARVCPPVSWRWWSGDQWLLAMALWESGVRDAAEVRLELGWTWDRLFRVARRVRTPDAALLSPVLWVDNDAGTLLVLTTRAREAKTCAEGLRTERRLSR